MVPKTAGEYIVLCTAVKDCIKAQRDDYSFKFSPAAVQMQVSCLK